MITSLIDIQAIGGHMEPDSTDLGVWLDRLREFNTEFHHAIAEPDAAKKHELLVELARQLVIYEQMLDIVVAADSVQRNQYE